MKIYLNVEKLPDIIRRPVKSTDSYTLQPEGIEIIRMQGQENDKAFFVIPNTSALCSLNELPLVSRDQVSKAIAWVEITQRVDKKIRHGDYSAGLFRAFALESSTSGSDITVAGPNYESAIRLFAGILSGSANPKEVF